MALEQLKAYRSEEKYGDAAWAGMAVFRCPNAQARGWAEALYKKSFPGHGGAGAPIGRRVRIKWNAEPGKAWLICYYRTRQPYRMRRVGQARLIGRMATEIRNSYSIVDAEGALVDGPDPDGVHDWRIIDGMHVNLKNVEYCVFQTATRNPAQIHEYRKRLQCVNAEFLPRFGANPGILLMSGLKYATNFGEVIPLDVEFRVSPYRDKNLNIIPWNAGTKKHQGGWFVVECPAFVQNVGTGATPKDWSLSAGAKERTLRWVPGLELGKDANDAFQLKVTDAAAVKMWREASFRDLDAMLVW